MNRKMKFQREADPGWALRLRELRGCERLFACMQCGTCSGTCPLSIYMEHTPRRVMNLVREGFRTDALSSNTIWLCASCYSCTVHCPQDIHITDIMYALKREAIREKLYPKRFPIPVLAQEFYRLVKTRGRNSELWLVLRMAFRSNPLILLSMIRSGFGLIRAGRISLKSEKIRDTKSLQHALGAKEEVA